MLPRRLREALQGAPASRPAPRSHQASSTTTTRSIASRDLPPDGVEGKERPGLQLLGKPEGEDAKMPLRSDGRRSVEERAVRARDVRLESIGERRTARLVTQLIDDTGQHRRRPSVGSRVGGDPRPARTRRGSRDPECLLLRGDLAEQQARDQGVDEQGLVGQFWLARLGQIQRVQPLSASLTTTPPTASASRRYSSSGSMTSTSTPS